jgi:hypothetical protein
VRKLGGNHRRNNRESTERLGFAQGIKTGATFQRRNVPRATVKWKKRLWALKSSQIRLNSTKQLKFFAIFEIRVGRTNASEGPKVVRGPRV